MICHRFATLLVQPLPCLTVFFPGGTSQKLTATTFAAQNKLSIDTQARGATTQKHSTPTSIMTTPVEGLSITLDKTQEPIKWFGSQSNEICDFSLDQEQSEPLLSKDKQSSVPNILEQIQSLVRDHMSDVLIDHCANQQLEWSQTIDLHQLVNAMSFTHLDHLSLLAGLRNSDQFNSSARHSMLSTTTPHCLSLVQASTKLLQCPIWVC